jgi:hypothetical protein
MGKLGTGMATGKSSNWQTLLGMARPLVADPKSGAKRVQAFRTWNPAFDPTPTTPAIRNALDALVRLSANDLQGLYDQTKKELRKRNRKSVELGYLAVLGAMSDHLAALHRRHDLEAREKRLFVDVQQELQRHKII